MVVAGLAIIIANLISNRFNLMGPLVLVAVGALVSVIPGAPILMVPPEVVLSIILPLLLFREAHNIPLRDIKRALRGVILNGTLMVVFVAGMVGFVGWGLGLSLGTALLIGAAIGPTDATAVTALGKGISRGGLVILRAESLINDGTALVVFALALEYVTGDSAITPGHATIRFLISFGGGALIGLLMGWLVMQVARFVEEYMLNNVFRFVVPLLVYRVAEEVEASGVLAVVVAGLYVARLGTPRISVQSRALARPVWGLLNYMLNSLLFLLVGFFLLSTARSLSSDSVPHALVITVVLFGTMLVARWMFGETMIRLIRLLDRRPSQRLRRTTPYERLVITTAGFRSAISLAVAFSIPEFLPNGQGFPYRDLILFVTSGVVILSLAIQGALLPWVVRLTERHPNSHAPNPEAEKQEVRHAITEGAKAVLDALPRLAKESGADPVVVARVREGWERKLRFMEVPAAERAETADSDEAFESEKALGLRAVQAGRQRIIAMRNEGQIEDQALIGLMGYYDIEEMRLVGPLELD